MKIPDNYLPTCIELLAQIDALFVPCRFHNMDRKAIYATWAARERFARSGLAFDAGGSGAARVASHRELQALRKAGVVTIQGTGKGRGVRLTWAADDALRTLTAGYRVDEAWPLLERIATLGGTKVLEFDIAGTRAGCTSAQLVNIENQALPFLVRGWLDSNSDSAGRVGYFIDPPGLAALKAGRPAEPDDLPEYEERWAVEYDRHMKAAIEARNALRPSERTSIVIPLGCGSWALPACMEEATNG